MGRATSGVTGMKFRDDDELLAMDVVREDAFLFTVTEGGIAKRTALTVENYRQQGRGGLGIKVANLPEANGDLVGAIVADADDEVLVIMERGKIVRSATVRGERDRTHHAGSHLREARQRGPDHRRRAEHGATPGR